MSDRELIELAAKAAGIDYVIPTHDFLYAAGLERKNDRGNRTGDYWNPLTDDGDGARLEAATGLNVEWFEHWVCVGDFFQHYAGHKGDKQAARRYAAVLAAAAIGKAMP